MSEILLNEVDYVDHGGHENEVSPEYLVIVDVQDLFFATKRIFGQDVRVDFDKLYGCILDVIGDTDVSKYRIIAYVVTGERSGGFIRTLKNRGYEVVLRRRKPKSKTVYLNVNMALDVLDEVANNPDLQRVLVVSSSEFLVPLSRYTEMYELGIEVLFLKGWVNRFSDQVVSRVFDIPTSVLIGLGSVNS